MYTKWNPRSRAGRRARTLAARAAAAAALPAAGGGAAANSPAQGASYDVIIAGGRVVDGTGAPWFYGDVGIRGDRIAAVGQLKDATATTRVNATGLVVAPGFIDMLG